MQFFPLIVCPAHPRNRHTPAFCPVLSVTTKHVSNSSTDHGGGKRRLFGDIHLSEAKDLCNRVTGAFLASQKAIHTGPISAVALGKSSLPSFTFNCGSQQSNEIALAKHYSLAVYFVVTHSQLPHSTA
jgi:hypothetical protein